LASLGNIPEAEKVLSNLRDVQLDDRERGTILATKGLIEFRKGNINEGRNLYEKAVASFRKKENFPSMAIASMFRAREEILIHSEFSESVLKEATTLAEKHGVKEISEYATFLASQIKTHGLQNHDQS